MRYFKIPTGGRGIEFEHGDNTIQAVSIGHNTLWSMRPTDASGPWWHNMTERCELEEFAGRFGITLSDAKQTRA